MPETENTVRLLDLLKQLSAAIRGDGAGSALDADLLPRDRQELTGLLTGILGSYQTADMPQPQSVLEKILNTLDNYVYVTDMDTDEILFVNKKMENSFGMVEQLKGDICWKRLQTGMEKRCEFCKKPLLLAEPGKPVIWEKHNSVLGRSFSITDRIIEWPDGRHVHLEHATDITETKQAQMAYERYKTMRDIINKAALTLLTRRDESFTEAMSKSIELISYIAATDRMSVFKNSRKPDGLRLSQIYRWRRDVGGTVDILRELIDIPYSALIPAWEQQLASGDCPGGIVRLTPEASALKQFGCITVLLVPVFDNGIFWGTILFEKFKEEVFSEYETEVLRSSSFMLANAVIRNEEAAIIRRSTEYVKLMLDATPLGGILWNSDRKIIDCNEATVKLFGAKDKTDFFARFFECSPEYQPDGRRSAEQISAWLNKAFDEGRCSFEWMHQMLDGTPLPTELTLVRIKYGKHFVVAAYSRDLRGQKRMIREIAYKNHLLQIVNHMSAIILKSRADTFENNLHHAMGILAEAVDVDRMYVWKNYKKDGLLYCTQIYEWSSNGVESQQNYALAAETLYSDIVPGWEEHLAKGYCINGIVREMSAQAQAALSPQGILSVLIVPMFLENRFWGFVGFDNCRHERVFSESEEAILCSASELITGALTYIHLENEADKIFYDPLTGIYNRRFFDENLTRIIQTLSRSGSPLSLMMIDIDNFKLYNDIYGHVEGDNCLKIIARTLQNNITRSSDFIARYGGEEFVAVLPNTDESGALIIARKLIESVFAHNIHHEKNGKEKRITISIGIATGQATHTQTASDYIRRADEMLYEAKNGGRNRYMFANL